MGNFRKVKGKVREQRETEIGFIEEEEAEQANENRTENLRSTEPTAKELIGLCFAVLAIYLKLKLSLRPQSTSFLSPLDHLLLFYCLHHNYILFCIENLPR